MTLNEEVNFPWCTCLYCICLCWYSRLVRFHTDTLVHLIYNRISTWH